MKKIMICLFLLLIVSTLLFATACKETETPEPSKEKTSTLSPGDPDFNPDEPAPVPEGTPPY
jgi:ABC-type oligopeptide transport system substrate-binding subunit